MIHRHVEVPSTARVDDLPSAAVADLLDRGDLLDWQPVAAAIRRQPFGPFAERVLRLVNEYPMYGTSPLWRAWIDRCRAGGEADAASDPPLDLAALRRRAGLTQAAVAARMGISQSDLSKLERRGDVRLSTLRAYAKALGGAIEVVFRRGAVETVIRVGDRPTRSRHSKRARVGQERSSADVRAQ